MDLGVEGITSDVMGPLDFLREILQVVEWLNKVDGRDKSDCSRQSSLAVRLEEKFNEANGKITALEGQLAEIEGENVTLKEKLNDMELLAGKYQEELIRLTRELETEKWKRFDTESRLKKMVEEVAELHSSVGELVSGLQEEEQHTVVPAIMANKSNQPVIKREVLEEEEQGMERNVPRNYEMEEREQLKSIFMNLSSQVQERLQKCEEVQVGTKAELNEIMKGLASIQTLISREQITRKNITMQSINASEIPRQHEGTSKSAAPSTPAPLVQPETKNPGPIKSILMKRSVDGTFKIRRNSEEQREPANAAKRKRVQFCLDDSNRVTVHAELKENQQVVKNEVNASTSYPADQQQVNHFGVTKEGEPRRKFSCNCGRNFVSKKLLNRHLSTKLNGKIFSCLMCSKTFVLHGSLKKHVRKSHRVQYHGGRFGCRVCAQTFAAYRQLRQHQITHQHKSQ